MPLQKSSESKSWSQQELKENRDIISALWDKNIVVFNPEAVNRLKKMMIENFNVPKSEVERIFSAKDFDVFFKACVKYLPSCDIWSLDYSEKLGITPTQDSATKITERDLEHIEQYRQATNIAASYSVACLASDEKLHSPSWQQQKPYAIHSIGKVFTGALMLRMIEEGIIPESKLNEPIKNQLSPEVWKNLPEKIKQHLEENKVTLHQVMIHQGGLGDYLDSYLKEIKRALDCEMPIPEIKEPEDFLSYADNNIFKVGEDHYSNLGILLVGLAIKQACQNKNYDEILDHYILQGAKIECAIHKPKEAIYDENDKLAPHIAGGPAGGYWMTAHDLAKFGSWLYKKSQDSKFMSLMEKYGQEFYYPEYKVILHNGGIPSSSAHLVVSVENGMIISVLSNQARKAIELGAAIRRHLFRDPERLNVKENKDQTSAEPNSTIQKRPTL
ncbi:MAG: hypothetical protein A3G71_01025 [Gammaproteobacteria bacterium RIFCSPLOWO2_12_FULL_38_14]|nr:MAG: hypothetical protein A3G71_01025 [Gammaproteobacteria bacterium RIFCSPLOWO2_12_FULL_38_14]